MKTYGPYRRKDGRQIVIHYDELTKSQHTQSYPRYLVEQFLGRKLETWEQVDHINNDHTDDRLENFQLLTQQQNNEKSRVPAKIYQFFCPQCGEWTTKSARRVRNNRRQGKKGPFCSKSCAAKATNGGW